MNYVDNSTKFSTAFGTVLSIFVNLQAEDILKTIILGFLGGVSSFVATLLVKRLLQMMKKNLILSCGDYLDKKEPLRFGEAFLISQNKSDKSIDALAFQELGLFWNIRNSIFQLF